MAERENETMKMTAELLSAILDSQILLSTVNASLNMALGDDVPDLVEPPNVM